ncbi:hypothetical protein D8S78_11720 [Natrialba swarupiae]|nr:hypothetical protein [Natrialba swarupiae]
MSSFSTTHWPFPLHPRRGVGVVIARPVSGSRDDRRSQADSCETERHWARLVGLERRLTFECRWRRGIRRQLVTDSPIGSYRMGDEIGPSTG